MKCTTKAVYTAALVSAILLVIIFMSGCGGGSESHDITAPSSGSVVGVKTIPPDSDTEVPTDAWIRVYWPYEDLRPPSDFTMRLEVADEDGDWSAVLTKLREDESDPEAGSWWFEPTYLLDSATWYRILVTDQDGQREAAVFRTSGSSSLGGVRSASETQYKPEGATRSIKSPTDGALEHRISR